MFIGIVAIDLIILLVAAAAVWSKFEKYLR